VRGHPPHPHRPRPYDVRREPASWQSRDGGRVDVVLQRRFFATPGSPPCHSECSEESAWHKRFFAALRMTGRRWAWPRAGVRLSSLTSYTSLTREKFGMTHVSAVEDGWNQGFAQSALKLPLLDTRIFLMICLLQ